MLAVSGSTSEEMLDIGRRLFHSCPCRGRIGWEVGSLFLDRCELNRRCPLL